MGTRLDKAIKFATEAHSGAFRTGTTIPYIVHPLEALSIAATLTDDEDILAATVLHDVLEDTSTSFAKLAMEFGPRIATLVASESEKEYAELPPVEGWERRKKEAVERIRAAECDVKIVAFSDKLANLRAIHRDYSEIWEELWERFDQKDPLRQLWYYGSFKDLLDEYDDLCASAACLEYKKKFNEVQARVQEYIDFGSHGGHVKVIATPSSNSWVFEDQMSGNIMVVPNTEIRSFCDELTGQRDL